MDNVPLVLVLLELLAACPYNISSGSADEFGKSTDEVLLTAERLVKRADTVHSEELEIDISLGMDKSEIDELFGEPIPRDGYHYYVDALLGVEYYEDKVVSLITTFDLWTGFGDIHVNDPVSKLIMRFGESPSPTSYTYFFDCDSNLMDDKYNAKASIIYIVKNDRITGFTVNLNNYKDYY